MNFLFPRPYRGIPITGEYDPWDDVCTYVLSARVGNELLQSVDKDWQVATALIRKEIDLALGVYPNDQEPTI